jgi:hypothetical protein
MTLHFSWGVNLGAVAMVVIPLIVAALVYLVYLGILKRVEEGKREVADEDNSE